MLGIMHHAMNTIKKLEKTTLSNFLQLFIKVIMVSSSHKPCFIYGQKVIDSVVGTPSISANIYW